MSTITDDKPKGRWLAFWLVLGHLIVGLIGCGISRYYHNDPSLLTSAFVGLVFGQTSLVGLWGGLGTRNWLVRLVGVLVGLIYLGTLYCIGIDAFVVVAVLMVVSAGLTTAGLLAVCRYFGLRIASSGLDKPERKAAQFSIRQLMGLTLVVACFIALAQWLVPHFNIGPFLLQLFLVGVSFAVLGLVSAWAILGTKHPKLGILSVLLIAPIFGFGGEALLSDGGEDLADWIAATMTEAVVLIVSLYAIRRGGFRVGRQRKSGPALKGGELHQEDKCDTLER
jgi:hypothetical protein